MAYESKIEPRDYQKPILKTLVNEIKNKGYIRGILQAKPGTGKTFMSIYFGQLFSKVLVIVPKDVLVDQWKQEFLHFTTLKPEEIGEIKGSDLDHIQQEISSKKVIITKPQSILSQIKRINYFDLYNVYSDIDFVIYDECHSAGAEGYSKALSLFKTPNILGLSATPFRKGLNEFLLKNSIGDVLIEAEADVLVPDVFIRTLPNSFLNFTEKELFALKQRLNDYPQMLALYNMFLSMKNNYISHITEWIKWGAIDQQRDTIVLFSTNKLAKKQLNDFIEKFPEYENDIIMLTGNSKNDALSFAKEENKKLRQELKQLKEELNQKVKNKELKRKEADVIYKEARGKIEKQKQINLDRALEIYQNKIKNARIIISNFSLLREGFDKKSLSFAIFGSPIIGKITLTQTLGRITRLDDNKPKPIALILLTEVFTQLNKSIYKIIQNNVKLSYDQANIRYI